ncbi:hypothetical protein P4O66_002832 [Electrophorus voltai]|uniref:Uncharacterized protein n=1 Tax=Electrophorus voltai TaxID=2609070 RepID=A0AAD8YUB8_9TELE|nr:hypothetical protein P4O66_002832 [Electrophorus voltai]
MKTEQKRQKTQKLETQQEHRLQTQALETDTWMGTGTEKKGDTGTGTGTETGKRTDTTTGAKIKPGIGEGKNKEAAGAGNQGDAGGPCGTGDTDQGGMGGNHGAVSAGDTDGGWMGRELKVCESGGRSEGVEVTGNESGESRGAAAAFSGRSRGVAACPEAWPQEQTWNEATTIYQIMKNLKERGSIAVKKATGCPRKSSKHQDGLLTRMQLQDQVTSSTELAQEWQKAAFH